jgi:DNA processing protein
LVEHDSLRPWLTLGLIPGLRGSHWRRLLEAFGEPAGVLDQSLASLARVVDPALAAAIRHPPEEEQWQRLLTWLRKPGKAVLTLADPRYPVLLRETPDPPPLLYAAGRIDLLARPMLAVVGSRNATAQGMRNAEAFASALASHGVCVVSGLALGIDAAAHRGGLRGPGGSAAVLGCGIDVVYPTRNAELYRTLMREGVLVSEFALGTAPLAHHFPRRNRIIAGMSRGCLVVEAAAASGSLITARMAVDMGRDVFAIPGSIHAPLSKGCHELIKQGAKLVDTAADVLEELGIEAPLETSVVAPVEAQTQHVAVLAALGHDPCDFDTLVARTGLTPQALLAALTKLELDRRATRTPAGAYQRLD